MAFNVDLKIIKKHYYSHKGNISSVIYFEEAAKFLGVYTMSIISADPMSLTMLNEMKETYPKHFDNVVKPNNFDLVVKNA